MQRFQTASELLGFPVPGRWLETEGFSGLFVGLFLFFSAPIGVLVTGLFGSKCWISEAKRTDNSPPRPIPGLPSLHLQSLLMFVFI